LYLGAGDKLLEVETRMADLAAIRDNLRAALDAGCDDPAPVRDQRLLPPAVRGDHNQRDGGVSDKIKDRHLFGA
jgi:hypothetical protein